jgi:acetylornithine/succinyldiaminopimelate/putrescine aminotransferase
MEHKHELQDKHKKMQAETVTMINGGTEATEEIGTLAGTIYDQFGNESSKIVMEEVSYFPNGTFNSFSLTQMTSKGWIMGGDNETNGIKRVTTR